MDAEWMQGHPIMGRHSGRIRSLAVWPAMDADYFLYVIELLPQGYLVLNSAGSLPPVVAFSSSSPVSLADREDNSFSAMLRQKINRTVSDFEKSPELSDSEVAETEKFSAQRASSSVEQYGPWLETSWNQCHPYNLFCPEVDGGTEYYGFRAPTGCVPAAFAQVLHYHRCRTTAGDLIIILIRRVIPRVSTKPIFPPYMPGLSCRTAIRRWSIFPGMPWLQTACWLSMVRQAITSITAGVE